MIVSGRGPCDEAALRVAGNGEGCAEQAQPWVLAATILGSSLAFIDGSVVNVALPAIQEALTSSVEAAQWVVNAYLLMLGALVLVGGAAGDRFGRRRLFVWGVALFTCASVICGLAPNSAVLIAARAAQGIGSAMLVPNSLALISAAFPADRRGKAIGSWAGASALTTALGPVLGGWLVDALSWRAIFFINLPIAGLALAIALMRVPESRRDESGAALDWAGALLAILGLGCLTYGLTAAASRGWTDPVVDSALAAGILILAGFTWHEARDAAPLVPLHLFRSRSFSGANTITLLLYFALGGALFFLPFDLIRIQHYTATGAGAAFLPLSLLMGMLSRWSGGLVARYGARLPLTIGPIVAAAGFALLAVPGIAEPYWTSFFPAMVVLGFGMTVSVAPLTTSVMGAVAPTHAGAASGINNAVARIAAMLAVSLLGALAVGLFGSALATRLADLHLPPEIAQPLLAEAPKLAGARVPAAIAGVDRALLERAFDESFLYCFRIIMLIAASLALLSAACGYVTIAGPSPAEKEPIRL